MERGSHWPRAVWICSVIAFAITARGAYQAPETLPHTIQLQTGEERTPYLGKHLAILKDEGGDMDIKEVVRSKAFQPSTMDIPDFGLGSAAYWAKLEVHNTSSSSRLFLHIAHSEIDRLDIYQADQENEPVCVVHAGLERNVNRVIQPTAEPAFPVDITPGSKTVFYIRMQGHKPLRLPLTVESPTEFNIGQQDRTLIIGGYLGIMLVMALYNFFIFLFTREKAYGTYVAYIILVALTQMAFIGMFSYYFVKDMSGFTSHCSLYFTAFTVIVAVEFMASFIHIKDHYPRALKMMRISYVFLVFGLLLDLSGRSIAAYSWLQACAGLFAMAQLIVGASIAFKGSSPARFFLVAWSAFLIGIIIFILKDVGVLPYNDLTRFAMTIGSAVEVVLLSFGLADKINALRREKERSQEEALNLAKENEQIVLGQNVLLEGKVKERTHALQESNDHLKRTQSQLVNAEKMAALGQLTAGIAHEINNPINFISSSIPPLKRDLYELREVLMAYRDARINGRDLEEVRLLEERIGLEFNMKEVDEILLNLESGAQRTSEIVRGLRTFSRLDEYDLKTVDVNEGIKSTLVVLAPQVRDAVVIELDFGELPLVECYAGKLNQVFMNLLNNAIFAVKQKHGATGGKVRVVSYHTGEHAIFEIHDNGTGMDEATQHRLFEPFFTTKDVGEGTGLGMSIALSIIEDHHGTITVQSSPGEGTIFTLTLPISQQLLHAKRA
jgi:two-component system NtrC family sensor kinase